MPDLGGIIEKDDVKLLILFVCLNSKRPLTLPHITEILVSEGLADFFDIAQGVRELAQGGQLEELPGESDPYLKITEKGEYSIDRKSTRLNSSH